MVTDVKISFIIISLMCKLKLYFKDFLENLDSKVWHQQHQDYKCKDYSYLVPILIIIN